MVNEIEINQLKNEIKRSTNRKMEYQRIDRDILENIRDFEDVKREIIKVQEDLKACDGSEEVVRIIRKMDEDITEVKSIITTLEEMKKSVEKKIRFIDLRMIEKENELKRLSMNY